MFQEIGVYLTARIREILFGGKSQEISRTNTHTHTPRSEVFNAYVFGVPQGQVTEDSDALFHFHVC